MPRHSLVPGVLLGCLALGASAPPRVPAAAGPAPAAPRAEMRGALVSPEGLSAAALDRLKLGGATAVVLRLAPGERAAAAQAGARVRAGGLQLYYWVDVGRSPELADRHPAWMASLQGHQAWRRHFPDAPRPGEGEVVKNYPWVPVRYREAFDAHLRRVKELLAGLPEGRGLFLNDLQAAPSACGCGNTLCRWTPDYGPVRTAEWLGPDAAARFVSAVRALAPSREVIPVWTPECEQPDTAKEGACGGVTCFTGACWFDFAEQLRPVARESAVLAALLPYRALGRDLPRYGPAAGWVGHALRSFAEMPPMRNGDAVPAERLIAVLQGWDVTREQREAQIGQARAAGARGYVMAEVEIPQGWEPRLTKAKSAARPGVVPSGHACASVPNE